MLRIRVLTSVIRGDTRGVQRNITDRSTLMMPDED
jgi:hypothetical protein